MEIIDSKSSYSHFFKTLSAARKSLLLLDYDGTLSPFTPDRDEAIPYKGVIPLLGKINDSDKTRLVIISGRSISSLQPLIGPDLQCELWGSHGLERFIPGRGLVQKEMNLTLHECLASIDRWAKDNGLSHFIEVKPVGRAFHWRGESQDRANEIRKMIEIKWTESLDQFGLALHSFDGGIEIRPVGISKAGAVRTLLSETTEESSVAYLGDDLTDEDAFSALGHRGLKVLVRSSSRTTKADIRVNPPDELLSFLEDWHKAISC